MNPVLRPPEESLLRLTRFAPALLLLALPSAGHAQLTLAEALRLAEHGAFDNRAAAGDAAEQAARAAGALQGVLPTVRFEAGYSRTTEPIGAFTMLLRQRAVTPASFDPARLNAPDAVGNQAGAIVVEQPLIDLDAWAGRSAAANGADASRARERWTRSVTREAVVRDYYAAVLAAVRVARLDAAVRAAHAHAAEAEAMVRRGAATRSDALLAAVRAGEVEADLAQAEGDLATARAQLAVRLGRSAAELPPEDSLPGALPDAARIRALAEGDTLAAQPLDRADVLAAERGLAAARADARREHAALLPRINSFARVDWNSADRLYGGTAAWTLGIMASWSIVPAPANFAAARAAAARTAAMEARAEAASAGARLESDATRTALIVALTRMDIAERALAQSAEAHRIVARKYEGGLATISELLDAQATETRTSLGAAQSRWQAIVALADRRRAMGGDPGTLAALDDAIGTDTSAAPPAGPAH